MVGRLIFTFLLGQNGLCSVASTVSFRERKFPSLKNGKFTMPICSNFPGRRQDLLSSTASSQPVKNLGAGREGSNGEGTWFWGCGWVMGETHQDRGYRYLGKEGRLTFSSCVFAASPFGYKKKDMMMHHDF